ncbi:hypothetical protein [Glaciihabitans sp. UYNi722]|uniref:hypothetical protein n=1 Tax=Glaciihabitans sp. UYNi722 TaxID=3156344 RepID=UPI003397F4B8
MKTNKGGHTVAVLEGNASGIVQRGTDIEDLGEQMIGAAGLLQKIGDGATEEKGRSIEKIRDEVGDAYKDLKLAGERYKPTGTVMKTYGTKLDAVQTAMRKIVADAEDAERNYNSKKQAAADAQSTVDGSTAPNPADATAVAKDKTLTETASTAHTDASTAETALHDQFTLFDAQWDVWDRAYEEALKGINDATEGNVSDDWTDNLAGFVDIVLKVLSWVGIALAVLALIVGGPIIAAIAAIVAVVALIGTLFLYFKGRKGLGDVAWAVVGVLPFGKLGKLFQSGKRMEGLTGFLKGPLKEITTPLSRIKSLNGLVLGSYKAGRAGGLGRLSSLGHMGSVFTRFSNFGGAGFANVWTRIAGGSSRAYMVAFSKAVDDFPAARRAILDGQLAGTPLAKVVSDGGQALTRIDQIFNVGEYAVKKGHTVETKVESFAGSSSVDAWRSQL